MNMSDSENKKFAIRFGLGAIKAVGFNMMENAVRERQENGEFKDVYDLAQRLDPRSINKKSIEALAKAGAFDCFAADRRQIAESFDILSAYSLTKNEESNSNQMSLFGGMKEADIKPELKKVEPWSKSEKLQKEFEAFGFFLNEHPIDDSISDLRKRGVIFSERIDAEDLQDNSLVKMAGVIASSKHRSSARGRFAYIYVSDPYGIFEATIFDEALITSARDLLVDGSVVALDCLIRKDEGGVRIMIREVKKLDEFIKNTEARKDDFEDIKKQAQRNYSRGNQKFEQKSDNSNKSNSGNSSEKKFIPNNSSNNSSNSGQQKPNSNVAEAAKTPPKAPSFISDVTICFEANKENLNDILLGLKQHISQLNKVEESVSDKNFAKIILQVSKQNSDQNQVTKIALPEKFKIGQLDLIRMQNLRGVNKVLVKNSDI